MSSAGGTHDAVTGDGVVRRADYIKRIGQMEALLEIKPAGVSILWALKKATLAEMLASLEKDYDARGEAKEQGG